MLRWRKWTNGRKKRKWEIKPQNNRTSKKRKAEKRNGTSEIRICMTRHMIHMSTWGRKPMGKAEKQYVRNQPETT